MGSGSYFAQEGVFEFGAKEWGPQPLQLMLSTVDCNAGSLGVAKDTGVKEIKRPQGQARRLRRRLAGAEPERARRSWPSAISSRSDVKIVEFSSYGAMWKGMINNDVDAAFATTITGPAKEARDLAARHRSGRRCPHDDKAGWERVQKVGSFFFPHMATCGAGISKDKPIELGNYPYPIFVVYGIAARRRGLCHHQGDDRGLRRLQGLRARRRAASRPTGRPRTGWFRSIPAR